MGVVTVLSLHSMKSIRWSPGQPILYHSLLSSRKVPQTNFYLISHSEVLRRQARFTHVGQRLAKRHTARKWPFHSDAALEAVDKWQLWPFQSFWVMETKACPTKVEIREASFERGSGREKQVSGDRLGLWGLLVKVSGTRPAPPHICGLSPQRCAWLPSAASPAAPSFPHPSWPGFQ